jgi:hypothetical protein
MRRGSADREARDEIRWALMRMKAALVALKAKEVREGMPKESAERLDAAYARALEALEGLAKAVKDELGVVLSDRIVAFAASAALVAYLQMLYLTAAGKQAGVDEWEALAVTIYTLFDAPLIEALLVTLESSKLLSELEKRGKKEGD